jgi:hypothetical protein
MDPASAATAVRVTLQVLARIAAKTRTPTDDFMVAVLKKNEQRLADVVAELSGLPTQPPTDAQVAQALERVGIHVGP